MRRLLCVLALLLPVQAWAQPALVQVKYGTSSSATDNQVITFDAPITAGNAIVCAIVMNNRTVTFTDNNGGAYTTYESPGSLSVAFGVALNHGSGSTAVTGTLSSVDYKGMGCAEFSGVATSAALDGTPTWNGAMTTAINGSLVVAVMQRSGGGTITEDTGAGWALITEDESYTNVSMSFIYEVLATAGSVRGSWTVGTVTTDAVMALLAGGGGGGSFVPSDALFFGGGQ